MALISKTLGQVFDETAGRFPGREAIVVGDRRVTFAEWRQRVDCLARFLLGLGVRKGDKVAIWLSNREEWAYSELAAAKIGAAVIPINTRYKPEEVEYILNQSESTVLIMMDEFLGIDFVALLRSLCPEIDAGRPESLRGARLPLLRHVICLGDRIPAGAYSMREVLSSSQPSGGEDPLAERAKSVEPGDIFIIPYTSGTTGFPKGVMTSHDQYLTVTNRLTRIWGLTEEDRAFIPAPFFHNLGNLTGVVASAVVGNCLVSAEHFDPGSALGLIERERCGFFAGSPTMYIMLLEHPEFPKRKITHLKKGMVGAAPTPVELVERIRSQLGMEGLMSAYGMTECTACTTSTRIGDSPETVSLTVGTAIAEEFELKVADPETGESLGLGKTGELWVKGPLVMHGYYKKEEETRKAMATGGWFRTGDLVEMDERGYLAIRGRIKDMFISGGTNVYPTEIENILHRHPKVKLAQVVGVPDHRLGEVGAAFVQLKEGETVTGEELNSFCRERMANYKVPRHFRIVKEFAVTATGKIQKFLLKEEYLREEVS